ncbi:hypothetical protein G7Y89_g8188 [Cudoniella acicularis]|uniref:G-patch domain-containing protein n=1 Tax=Cudoniella acicularis TaxID=354080 RepID=A0A8H4W1B3_9HELO|nr:hypothetical protein G7Y89_g8188 [Cudoniella acicularis]
MSMSDDDTYEIPLQDQRVFGAGIKRKRVHFVSAASTSNASSVATTSKSAKAISDLYLKLVLPESPTGTEDSTLSQPPSTGVGPSESLDGQPFLSSSPSPSQVCEICSLPLSSLPAHNPTTVPLNGSDNIDPFNTRPPLEVRPHEASLAHQVCLQHSHPPSHLDRKRKGLTILSNYGFDPDAQQGLGPSGQGIQYPIKAKPKDDKLGIGVVLPKEGDRRKKKKPEKLDAGQVKRMHEKDKRKTERLREIFYQNEDVDRYLGKG